MIQKKFNKISGLKVLGVYREKKFSPGKISQDAAILDATLALLPDAACRVNTLQTEDLNDMTPKPDLVLSMAQSARALDFLDRWGKSGVRIINSVQSVRNCYRKALIRCLQKAGIPIPLSRIVKTRELKRYLLGNTTDCWLKRGDVHAMQSADVVRVKTETHLSQALAHFRSQKIEDILVQDHADGKVIKFYGVGGDLFFHAYEVDSGSVVAPKPDRLVDVATRAALAAGLDVYGGDAVLTPSGTIVLIDLNDWPSFSSCCTAAAQGIATYIRTRLSAKLQ